MSEIKSAYEKAMERFADVQPNKASLRKKESIDKGKLLCAQALEDKNIDIVKEIAQADSEVREWLKDGIGESLLAQIALPSNEAAMMRVDDISKIAMSLSPNPAVVEQLMKQYREICQKFMEEQASIGEQMQQQLAQMQQQAGGNEEQMQSMQAQLMKAVQERVKEIQGQFQPAIQKIKANLRQLCGFALEK